MKIKAVAYLIPLVLLGMYGCFQTQSSQPRTSTSTVPQVFALNSVRDLQDFLTYDDHRYPIVSAHRGGPTQGYPENAIETFANIAAHMPAIIECDVSLSKDSIMVLMHDETLDRTSTGTGKTNSYTLQELKQLRLKDTDGNITDFRIPTLEETLLWGKDKVIFTLDIKREVPYQKVAEVIERTKAQTYSVIITYTTNQAVAVHRIAPELMISATVKSKKDLQRLYDAGIPDNQLVAFIGTRKPDKELVDAVHDHGIKIILGTIGNLDKQAANRGYQVYAEYVQDGADILSTDRPFEAYKALDFYIRKRGISSPFIKN